MRSQFGLIVTGVILIGSIALSAQRPGDPTAPTTAPAALQPSFLCAATIFSGAALDRGAPKPPSPRPLFARPPRPFVCRDMSRVPPLRRVSPNRLPLIVGPGR